MRAAHLGGDRLAEHHGTRLAQGPDRGIVPFRKISTERLATHLGGHVLRFQQVLDRDRHAVDRRERRARLPARGARIGRGTRTGFVQVHEGLHHGFARSDVLDRALEIRARRVRTIAKARYGIVESKRLESARVVGGFAHGAISSVRASNDARATVHAIRPGATTRSSSIPPAQADAPPRIASH